MIELFAVISGNGGIVAHKATAKELVEAIKAQDLERARILSIMFKDVVGYGPDQSPSDITINGTSSKMARIVAMRHKTIGGILDERTQNLEKDEGNTSGSTSSDSESSMSDLLIDFDFSTAESLWSSDSEGSRVGGGSSDSDD